MNNSSTSSSELRIFLRSFLVRATILICIIIAIFFLPIKRSYYTELTRNSDYSKIDWVENRLNQTDLTNKEIFVGSSVCFNGINDSILNQGNPEGRYMNLGFTHTCFAITDALIYDIIHRRNQRPSRVYLCIKGDAMPRKIHNMYSLFATPKNIIQSISFENTYWLANILKRVSWNVNYISSIFKFKDYTSNKIFKSHFGYKPLAFNIPDEVEKNYQRNAPLTSKNLNATEQFNLGQTLPWRQVIARLYFDYFENIQYQKNIFANTARMLEEANIPFCFIQYPNLVSARMGRPDIMPKYFQQINPQIDFYNHPIIIPDDTAFSNVAYYNDMNHLNPKGAAMLTRFIEQKIQQLPRTK